MKKQNKLIHNIKSVLLTTGFEGSVIHSVATSEDVVELIIQLPYQADLEDFKSILPNLQMELSALDHKIIETKGKIICIHFGKANIDDIPFNTRFIKPDTCNITLCSSFGDITINLLDGASCHLLNGGAPRMGKTIFLLYLCTVLYVQNDSNIELYINSPKLKDFYPFFHKKNVTVCKRVERLEKVLNKLLQDYNDRDKLLYSSEYELATDAKSVQEFYPDKYHLFKPIILVIDEYARYSDNEKINAAVEELVSTAGYVNIHVIIATQRPEARKTLPANIKQGLQCRICFKVADQNNSIVVLDDKGAENLPNIKGRAIVRDGELSTIQVPHLTYKQCKKLLAPYQIEREDIHDNKNTEGSTNQELSIQIQSRFKESALQPDIQSKQQPNKRMQQNHEKISKGWQLLANPTIKG